MRAPTPTKSGERGFSFAFRAMSGVTYLGRRDMFNPMREKATGVNKVDKGTIVQIRKSI